MRLVTDFSLSRRPVELRKSRGFSQRQVAEMIEIIARSYHRYESGERESVLSSMVYADDDGKSNEFDD